MKISKLIISLSVILITSIASAQETTIRNILIVTSNQHTYGDTDLNAANHFEEIVVAYDIFIKAGLKVDFVSPKGGAIPIGYIKTSDSIQKQYLYDEIFMNKLENTLTPSQASQTNYSAIYFSGGGAAMFGVPENEQIQRITKQIFIRGGTVSAVCHGTAGITKLINTNGRYLFEDKRITGYPDAFERKNAAYYKTFPFSIEQAVKEKGGIFQFSEQGWDGFYITDGRLITGQDPTATSAVAEKVVTQISIDNHE
ncbi:MAG: type 1 glutamine amidotransferase domain-containing protein [Bacteroidota bacterium]